jgi:hypothetical protein
VRRRIRDGTYRASKRHTRYGAAWFPVAEDLPLPPSPPPHGGDPTALLALLRQTHERALALAEEVGCLRAQVELLQDALDRQRDRSAP